MYGIMRKCSDCGAVWEEKDSSDYECPRCGNVGDYARECDCGNYIVYDDLMCNDCRKKLLEDFREWVKKWDEWNSFKPEELAEIIYYEI